MRRRGPRFCIPLCVLRRQSCSGPSWYGSNFHVKLSPPTMFSYHQMAVTYHPAPIYTRANPPKNSAFLHIQFAIPLPRSLSASFLIKTQLSVLHIFYTLHQGLKLRLPESRKARSKSSSFSAYSNMLLTYTRLPTPELLGCSAERAVAGDLSTSPTYRLTTCFSRGPFGLPLSLGLRQMFLPEGIVFRPAESGLD
jgi:hypothetical protein